MRNVKQICSVYRWKFFGLEAFDERPHHTSSKKVARAGVVTFRSVKNKSSSIHIREELTMMEKGAAVLLFLSNGVFKIFFRLNKFIFKLTNVRRCDWCLWCAAL